MKTFVEIMLIAILANLVMRVIYNGIQWVIQKPIITSIILTFLFISFVFLFFPSIAHFLPLDSISIFNINIKSSIEIILMTICALSIIQLLYAGTKWLNSHGDKDTVEGARTRITSSLLMLMP